MALDKGGLKKAVAVPVPCSSTPLRQESRGARLLLRLLLRRRLLLLLRLLFLLLLFLLWASDFKFSGRDVQR